MRTYASETSHWERRFHVTLRVYLADRRPRVRRRADQVTGVSHASGEGYTTRPARVQPQRPQRTRDNPRLLTGGNGNDAGYDVRGGGGVPRLRRRVVSARKTRGRPDGGAPPSPAATGPARRPGGSPAQRRGFSRMRTGSRNIHTRTYTRTHLSDR